MQNSIMLAQAFGIYLVVMGVVLLINHKYVMTAINAFVKDKALQLVSSIFTVFAGSFLVAYHNVWVKNWMVVITVLCWITLLKGVLKLLLPDLDQKLAKTYSHNYILLVINALIAVGVGAFLLYHGYYLGDVASVKKYIFF